MLRQEQITLQVYFWVWKYLSFLGIHEDISTAINT